MLLHLLEAFIGSGVRPVRLGILAARAAALLADHQGTRPDRQSDLSRRHASPRPDPARRRSCLRPSSRELRGPDRFPFLGAAVCLASVGPRPCVPPRGRCCRALFKGSVFLLSLVLCASMMPVEHLPAASWQTALGLGFSPRCSTTSRSPALAAEAGPTTGASVAYAVGFGGSMIWFGSSAGVALSNMYPEARSVGRWLRHGWTIALGYVIGYFVMLATIGFHRAPCSRAPAPADATSSRRGSPPPAGARRSRCSRATSRAGSGRAADRDARTRRARRG